MLPSGIEIDQRGPTVTITVDRPELSHTEMQAIVDACAEHMRYDKAQNFVFDLAEVDYLASACLGVLVEFLQDVEHCRGRIAFANCRDNVAFLFKVTRLDSVFGLYDDAAQAVASF